MLILIPIVTVGLILLISGLYVAYASRIERRGGRIVISDKERAAFPIAIGIGIGGQVWVWFCHSVQRSAGSGKLVEMPLAAYCVGSIAFCAAGVLFAERLIIPLFGRWSRRYREKLASARMPETI